MEKETESYKKHDKDYTSFYTLEKSRDILKLYTSQNLFETSGFKQAFNIPHVCTTHVDIGSGIGWLLHYTSPLFQKVIGIEPSSQALETAKILSTDIENVSYINSDMIEAFHKLPKSEVCFFTSAIVFSHIKNSYVEKALKFLNASPNESRLYFDEPYDKNIQQKLWHIRSKNWWAKQLPEWQLTFFDIPHDGYVRGIYGVKVGKENVKDTYTKNTKGKLLWYLDFILNVIKRIIRQLQRLSHKTKISKIFSFMRNKLYRWSYLSYLRKNTSKKILNHEEFLNALTENSKEEFIIEHSYRFNIKSTKTDAWSIGETCVREDYQRYPELKIKKGDIVFDIGAHIGDFSIYAATLGATVYAFEPEKESFNRLKENIKLNNLEQKIIPLNYGVYSHSGFVSFNTEGVSAGHSVQQEGNHSIKVKMFKEVLKTLNVKKIDLLKIDVEGSEYEIFKDLDRESATKISKIVGEYHILHTDDGFNKIKSFLTPHFKTIKRFNPYYFYAIK